MASSDNPATLPESDDTIQNKQATEDTTQNKQATDETNVLSNSFEQLLTKNNVMLLIGFLGIYFIAYYLLGSVFNRGEGAPSAFNMGLSRTIDLMFLLVLIMIGYVVYDTYDKNPDSNLFGDFTKSVADYVSDPFSAFTTALFIGIFYVIIYLFRIPREAGVKPIFVSLVENTSWILLAIILILDFINYVLGISFYDLFPFLDTSAKTIPEEETKPEEPTEKCEGENNKPHDPDAEVFNISNNRYTYQDAQAICKSYDAELATYDQLETAYNNGAEWCNYGWSDGQMALFPTQKNTWQKLQDLDKKNAGSKRRSVKNNCGRPGINGGYFENPYLKFGVNCFGKKPKATDADIVRMNAKNEVVYPKTPEDIILDNKVAYWKKNADKVLNVNSYNTQTWSERMPNPTNNESNAKKAA